MVATGQAIGFAVISLVAERRARGDGRSKSEERLEMRRVGLLSAGQIEGEDMTVEVGFEVDLGREAASAAPESLAVLPPLAPAAET